MALNLIVKTRLSAFSFYNANNGYKIGHADENNDRSTHCNLGGSASLAKPHLGICCIDYRTATGKIYGTRID